MTTDFTSIHHQTPSNINIYLSPALPSPEVMAMLQAKYSRDPGSVIRHLEDVTTPEKAQKFMETYLVKYGHRSIGRCGTLTLFVEGISLLAASWLVHTPRFNGQECSTRYLDFSKQGFYEPVIPEGYRENLDGEAIQSMENYRLSCVNFRNDLMDFYHRGLAETISTLVEKFPFDCEATPKVSEAQYHRSVRAKAFDVMRGFLPVSVKTNVAITMTLTDFQDHILFLQSSGLKEVNEIGDGILKVCLDAYPSSFVTPTWEETRMNGMWLDAATSQTRHDWVREKHAEVDVDVVVHDKNLFQLFRGASRLANGTKLQLPREFERAATVIVKGHLDFGSWRDLHRHTSLDHDLVELNTGLFEPYYIDSLPDNLKEEAAGLLKRLTGLRPDVYTRKEDFARTSFQYLIPLGFKIPVIFKGGIRSIHYLIKLRSQDTVHPTLRAFIMKIAQAEGLKEIDFGIRETVEDELNLRRGNQTILKRGEE